MTHTDAIPAREQISPAAPLHIYYDSCVDGEKTPQVIEPSTAVLGIGGILLDFWRSGLNGHIDDITSDGFRLTIIDRYGLAEILVRTDAKMKTFTITGDPTGPRSLSVLRETLVWIAVGVREERAVASLKKTTARDSMISRLTRRLPHQ